MKCEMEEIQCDCGQTGRERGHSQVDRAFSQSKRGRMNVEDGSIRFEPTEVQSQNRAAQPASGCGGFGCHCREQQMCQCAVARGCAVVEWLRGQGRHAPGGWPCI